YGRRPDERAQGWDSLFTVLKTLATADPLIRSDMNPHYISYVKNFFPLGHHHRVKGKRGAVVGQGELKKIGFDPLFFFNHTAAMLRANINRLFRKTWCTTKKPEALARHIHLYMQFHNEVLIKA